MILPRAREEDRNVKSKVFFVCFLLGNRPDFPVRLIDPGNYEHNSTYRLSQYAL